MSVRVLPANGTCLRDQSRQFRCKTASLSRATSRDIAAKSFESSCTARSCTRGFALDNGCATKFLGSYFSIAESGLKICEATRIPHRRLVHCRECSEITDGKNWRCHFRVKSDFALLLTGFLPLLSTYTRSIPDMSIPLSPTGYADALRRQCFRIDFSEIAEY